MKANELFQRAVERDPSFVQAYSSLARSYLGLQQFNLLPINEALPRAKAAALRALEIDDSLAETQFALSQIFYYERDHQSYERTLQRALELNPSFVDACRAYAYYFSSRERHDEAIAQARKSWELDPSDIRNGFLVGRILYFARQYDQAIQQYRRMVALRPSYASSHLFLGLAYVQKGNHSEAIDEMEKGVEFSPVPTAPAYLAFAYAVAGRTEEAQEILQEIERDNVSAGHIALVYAGLGEKDKALAWLETAYDTHDSWLFQLQDAVWDPLRDDPRFKDLLRRLNLLVQ